MVPSIDTPHIAKLQPLLQRISDMGKAKHNNASSVDPSKLKLAVLDGMLYP